MVADAIVEARNGLIRKGFPLEPTSGIEPLPYSWSMPKDQNKKRTAKTNNPKLTAKQKKLKKLAKKGK